MGAKSKLGFYDKAWNPITGCGNMYICRVCPGRKFVQSFSGDIRRNKSMRGKYRKENGTYVLEKEFVLDDGSRIRYPFGFEPTVHEYKLSKLPYKSGHRIFVGSLADMFGPWIKDDWIGKVFRVCADHPQHIYLFLTNYVQRYEELLKAGSLPGSDNMWFGVCDCGWPGKRPEIQGRHWWLYADITNWDVILDTDRPKWVVIHYQGKNGAEIQGAKRSIKSLAMECEEYKIPVYMTPEARGLLPGDKWKIEWPREMNAYLERKRYTPAQRDVLFTECNLCGQTFAKKEMYPVSARGANGSQRDIGYVCRSCADRIEEMYGFRFSRLEGWNEKAEL